MRSWETGSEHLPPPVKQIVSQCIGISEHLGGKLLDPTSCGRTKGMSVHGHVREERIADRSSDLTDQQAFGGIYVRDLTDDSARQVGRHELIELSDVCHRILASGCLHRHHSIRDDESGTPIPASGLAVISRLGRCASHGEISDVCRFVVSSIHEDSEIT